MHLLIYSFILFSTNQQHTHYEHNWQYASAIVKYQELPEDDLI
jgi:hypothetical protein